MRLLRGSVEDVAADARELLHDVAGHRFIPANSDRCPPGVEYEKFQEISRLIAE